jgi:rod shape determining protein RodA
MRGSSFLLFRIDPISLLLIVALSTFGWFNIYSTTIESDGVTRLLDLGTLHGKQLFFGLLSLVACLLLSFIDDHLIKRYSSISYLIGIALLLGLFVFGRTIAGSTSWYDFGPLNFQPSELMKVMAALALAKYLSDTGVSLRLGVHQFYAVLIIAVPIVLIVLQPDPGSALVFMAFFLVLFREGLPLYYLAAVVFTILAFSFTLIVGRTALLIAAVGLLTLYFIARPKKSRPPIIFDVLFPIVQLATIALTPWVFESVFKQHHRDRFSLWLGLENNPDKLLEIKQSIGYNAYQAEQAIASGRWWGKGYLQGTRTKGDFVPAQHTDYIFSSVGEEWGFVVSALVILAFVGLLLRLIILADRQKLAFHRIYGYGVFAILFIHFTINIGMVLGMLPTIGIPLPFFSYGGSGLFFFILMCFLFLKMDANRHKTHFN